MGIQRDPKSVVGRDDLIRQIWAHLRKPPQDASLRFTAERRVGKTTVMTKMASEPADDFEVLFLEVEGIDTCDSLTQLLLNRMWPLLSKSQKARTWFEKFRHSIGGTEIANVIRLPSTSKLGWQATLQQAIEGLCQSHSNRTILLMFDELPYMLQKIDEVSPNPYEALTLLDTFRSLRQRHANLRMIYAGSVGLHHVLRDLKKANLPAEPLNDMPLIEIQPLAEAHAIELAIQLLNANQVQLADDPQVIARRLIEQTNGIPFYMERITSRLAILGCPITSNHVDQAVLEHLTSDHDPWEMEHFRSRLKTYYRDAVPDTRNQSIPEHTIARAVLDHFATTDDPQTIDQVWQMLRGQFAIADRQLAVQMLKSLAQDHYLISDSQKRYTFRFPLIKRWWRTAQGLDS